MTEPSENPDSKDISPSSGGNEERDEVVRVLEARALELQSHIQEFSGDLKALSENLEARKRETAVLKIMLYTGLIVLMLAFFYSSNALHKAQFESFEHNLNHLQTLTESNMDTLQRGVMQDMALMGQRLSALEAELPSAYDKERKLGEVLMSMNSAISPLAERSPLLAERVVGLHRQSDELFAEFQRYAADSTLPEASFSR